MQRHPSLSLEHSARLIEPANILHAMQKLSV